MDKTTFVTYLIQHDEDFPALAEITVEKAAQMIEAFDPDEDFIPKDITPDFLTAEWNRLIHDPEVMTE